jgi:anthranilate/para-aminobenzoate synthase component I/branched-subunit amino acid aminotransferase/4-amino-4-deoxychorismate lyase
LAQDHERNVSYRSVDTKFLVALTQTQCTQEPFSIVKREDEVLLCRKPTKIYSELKEIPSNTFVTGWQNYDGKSGHWTSWSHIQKVKNSNSETFWDPGLEIPKTANQATWTETFSELNFIGTVKQIRKEMESGEYFLVNLTRTLHSIDYIDFYYLAAMSCLYHYSPFRYFEHNLQSDFLGLSPERFLKIENRKVTCEPMKGTAEFREQLSDNKKEHDENTMMIDLVRSDLSRICDPDSIHVEGRNIISSHPGLSQMSSKLTGMLTCDNILEAVSAMFPVASTSGTPKPRVVRSIDEFETENRNQYCGAYGWIDTTTKACDLAVSIRCIISHGTETNIGIGAGITIDSDPKSEWDETELKALRLKQLVNLTVRPESKGVFTSTNVGNNGEIFAFELHKERLMKHAELEGLTCNETKLNLVVNGLIEPYESTQSKYLKISIDENSNIKADLFSSPAYSEFVDVGMSFLPRALENETTKIVNREFYERALRSAQLMTNEPIDDAFVVVSGLVTETTRANIFIELDGIIVTPHLDNHLLAGIARASFLSYLKENRIEFMEKEIPLQDLLRATEVVSINSVRGPQRVRKISNVIIGNSKLLDKSDSKIFELATKLFNSQFSQINT